MKPKIKTTISRNFVGWLKLLSIPGVLLILTFVAQATMVVVYPAFGPSIPSSANGAVDYTYTFGGYADGDVGCGYCVDGDMYSVGNAVGKTWQTGTLNGSPIVNNGVAESYGQSYHVACPSCYGGGGGITTYQTSHCRQSMNGLTDPVSYSPDQYYYDGQSECHYEVGEFYNSVPESASCDTVTDTYSGTGWSISYTHPTVLPCSPFFWHRACHCPDPDAGFSAYPTAWGHSGYYKLVVHAGLGVNPPSPASLGIPNPPSIVSGLPQPSPGGSPLGSLIAAGGYHSLTISNDSSVWAWGQNWWGQLGDGTQTQRSSPVQVMNLSGINAIAAGYEHSLALKSDGTVWAWGSSYYAQLGNGSGPCGSCTPGPNPAPVKVGYRTAFSGVSSIAAGAYSSYAVKSNGTAWAWGYNANGQLGDGSTTTRNVPIQVTNLTGVVSMAGGWSHALALTTNGVVYSWGLNFNGQLGNGTTNQSATPVLITTLSNIVAISAGGYSSYALDSGGTLWVWGKNNSGQLGNGQTTDSHVPVSISLSGLTGISAGFNFCLGLSSAGSFYAWGDNTYGELGNGNQTQQNSPVQISFSDGSLSGGVAAGYQHSLSAQQDGTLRSWGSNATGQLGNGGTGGNQLSPGPVAGFY